MSHNSTYSDNIVSENGQLGNLSDADMRRDIYPAPGLDTASSVEDRITCGPPVPHEQPPATTQDVDQWNKDWISSEAQDEPERFNLVSCTDFLQDKTPPRSIIENLLLGQGAFWLYGLWGSCKTFLAIHMACVVALGAPFFGRRTRASHVVYLAGEGHRNLRRRFQAGLSQLNVTDLPVHVSDKGGRLDEEGQRHIIEVLDVLQVKNLFIIFDTQSTWSVSEENSNTESNEYIDFMKFLSDRYAACVLTIHHTTKDGESMRGAGNFSGCADGVFRVKKKKKDGDDIVEMSTEKLRDFSDKQSFAFRVKEVMLDESWLDEYGGRVSTLVLDPDPTGCISGHDHAMDVHDGIILDLVKEHPEASQKRLKELIRDATGLGVNKAGDRLRDLVNTGKILRSGDAKGTSYKYYIPSPGLNAKVAEITASRKRSK